MGYKTSSSLDLPGNFGLSINFHDQFNDFSRKSFVSSGSISVRFFFYFDELE